jgi:hypothetical protein
MKNCFNIDKNVPREFKKLGMYPLESFFMLLQSSGIILLTMLRGNQKDICGFCKSLDGK